MQEKAASFAGIQNHTGVTVVALDFGNLEQNPVLTKGSYTIVRYSQGVASSKL